MSTLYPYSYTVLRYVHDTNTGEFINVGVALRAPDAKYASALCRKNIGRLRKVFPDMNVEHFKSLMRHIENRIECLGERLCHELPLDPAASAIDLATRILPKDDSSLQWSKMGVGRTEDPAITLETLFERFVTHYDGQQKRTLRTDDDVWRSFKRNLQENQMLYLFKPKKIVVQDDEIEFQYTWKNGVLHCLEPVSFDLSSAERIRTKAHQWLGRVTSVVQPRDDFRIYFLIGRPSDANLQGAFQNARGILCKAPVDNEVYDESQVGDLSARIAGEVAAHQDA